MTDDAAAQQGDTTATVGDDQPHDAQAENDRLHEELTAENDRLRERVAAAKQATADAQGMTDEDVRRAEHPEEFAD